jgi:hypothetical protein
VYKVYLDQLVPKDP